MKPLANCIIAFVAALTLLATCCLAQPPADTTPSSAPSARAVIDAVLRDVLAILRDPAVTRTDKLTRIRQVADQHIDFETFARLCLGRYWRDLSDAQRAEYVKEFENHMSATHGRVFDEYVDEDVMIIGERQEQRGDCTIQTKIVASEKAAGGRRELAKVDYRLRQKDSRWKIIDVTIDGVSMAANFRAEFQDIMAKGGIERLLKLLKEKNVAGKQ